MMTVSVITSTIGRPELRKCVESVAAQTYPCKHYVFVNGPKYHQPVRDVLGPLDFNMKSHIYFLAEETGAVGADKPDCNGVFAAAPYLTNADWIFYLNDDDFFDENHVWSLVDLIQRHDLKWAYSLRKFVDINDQVICEDNFNSLGSHTLPHAGPPFVDNSCFAVSRRLACQLGMAWSAVPIMGDRCFFMALQDSGEKYGCTGLYTTNYRIGTGTAVGDSNLYLESDKLVRAQFPKGFPWAGAQVFC